MGKTETKNQSNRKGGGGGGGRKDDRGAKKGKKGGPIVTTKRKREIVFDPEARRNFLRGFSERKRQRRAFGLAMQRVKDRNAKIEQRAIEKKDELERVEQAEHQKELLLEEALRERMRQSASSKSAIGANKSNDDDDSDNNEDNFDNIDEESDDDDDDGDHTENNTKKKAKKNNDVACDTIVYNDTTTASMWGGQVTVTTSFVDLDGDDDEDDDGDARGSDSRQSKKKKPSVDVEQKYAGKVEKYLNKLKGNMPGKSKNGGSGIKAKRKGKDGRADMQGMGGSGNLKIAQKLLSKSKEKMPSGGRGRGDKKNKGKKHRR